LIDMVSGIKDMNKFEAMSGFFYTAVKRNAVEFPEKPAVIDGEGNKALYKDILNCYDTMRGFLHNSGIGPWQRFAFYTEDTLALAMLQLPVFENAVISHIDSKIPDEKIKYYFELLNHDYLVTDDPDSIMCRTAAGMGLGILIFRRR